jgi:hypothetical protein
MEHWRHVLPMKMLEVNYETMVTDMEGSVRKMLEFLEVDWDARCLSPHTNKGAIDTASKVQARQPVYTKSVQRWRHYEKHLGPLKQALELAGPESGN